MHYFRTTIQYTIQIQYTVTSTYVRMHVCAYNLQPTTIQMNHATLLVTILLTGSLQYTSKQQRQQQQQ